LGGSNTKKEEKDEKGHIKTTSSSYDAFRKMAEENTEDKPDVTNTNGLLRSPS
jgi:hypothetical protein